MSAWELVTDDGISYGWRRADNFFLGDERIQESSPSCVPSMVDLLREESWKMEDDERFPKPTLNAEEPMFRTGSGKPVILSRLSLAKAISVIGDANDQDAKSVTMKVHDVEKFSFSSPSSLFLSGSGKSISVSAASLDRAKNLLENDQSNSGAYAQPFQSPIEQFDEKSGENIGYALPVLGKTGECFEPISMEEDRAILMQSNSDIKFQTASGKSLSVSRDALKRARSLLAEPYMNGFLNGECFSYPSKLVADGDMTSGRESLSSFTNPGSLRSKFLKNSFVSPLKPNHGLIGTPSNPGRLIAGENLMYRFNEVEENSISDANRLHNGPIYGVKPSFNSGRALTDISNTLSRDNQLLSDNEMKRSARKSFGCSFKKPRSSKFIAPLSQTCFPIPICFHVPASSSTRRIVSSRFPNRNPRIYVKEYLTSQSYKCKLNVDAHAELDKGCDEIINVEIGFLQNMLMKSGASLKCASREWIVNHCNWITWKLASYDNNDHFSFPTKLLTSSNVYEELKYRYEREFIHGHRSAIKRILEGEAPASSLLFLCVSAIQYSEEQNSKLELFDGWYSVSATLDAPLSRQLAKGKLFVGQKLRIWGASLNGWVGPISPLEASGSVTFALHINGTYRAHWGDRLGFCRKSGHPLAFRCIKCDGGPVPRTLVGISRIYPLLFKERLSNGGSIVRSERLEVKVAESHNHRRTSLVEWITSEFQKEHEESRNDIENDSEGAKIFHALERAAEPDILMADMSPEQLSSFASYQSKLKAIKQVDMQKAIEKALKESKFREREVTPFLKVKVFGLSNSPSKLFPNEGIITIWSPTQKLINELTEGEAYIAEGLVPFSTSSTTLYLQATVLTKWRPLTSQALKNYEPFFVERSAVSVGEMGKVALGSEFDTIGYVVHVGDARWVNQQQEQWVFISDESSSVLAVRFWWHCLDDDPFAAVNFSGSVVGMCNLMKRAKDSVNQFWMADASENSTFYLSFGSSKCAHLQKGAGSVEKWANKSPTILEHLKNQVLSAIGGRVK